MTWKLVQTYRELPHIFYIDAVFHKVSEPKWIIKNERLAAELQLSLDDCLPMCAGNEGEIVPLAQSYAGHQFGHFRMLGDGRAMLLGEYETKKGLVDIQLKGSGPTPYSRGGDGRAALGPMLREYIISEAMYALGIPTTRSLAVVATGESVLRQTEQQGAVLTRVASSHIRVGTFEFAAQFASSEDLRALADYTIARHDAEVVSSEHPYLAFLQRVIERQAKLVASWQLVGFVHGVMNTDNMAISGETIDYGPCAFLDTFRFEAVFSSIDRKGRYAYREQPNMALWNLTRLAESLLPLLHEDEELAVEMAQQALEQFATLYFTHWTDGMRRKLGLASVQEGDEELFGELLQLMEQFEADYTNTFRALSYASARKGTLFQSEAFAKWEKAWHARLALEETTLSTAYDQMNLVNPAVIARNYYVEEALRAAEAGDLSKVDTLVSALQSPYTLDEALQHFAHPPRDDQYRTFCGT